MSFEGYDEFLCKKGHYWAQDAYDPREPFCPRCGQEAQCHHVVDQTNGIVYMENGEPHPSTVPYPFEEIDYEDKWHEDHYGNKYAIKIPLYKPKELSDYEETGSVICDDMMDYFSEIEGRLYNALMRANEKQDAIEAEYIERLLTARTKALVAFVEAGHES